MIKRIWVYDTETLNIFTATFIDKDSDDTRVFVLTSNINQISELLNFLNTEVSGLIGYNNISFDAQVLEFIYRHPNCIAEDIRRYAQIITSDDNRRPDVPEWKLRIPQLDLYRINHFDNKNRRTSLKWCEFAMDLDNIEDMPSQGDGDNWVDQVLAYNFNDVVATKALYFRTLPMINTRISLTKKYGINMMNYSNTKIGSELLLKLYCEKTGKLRNDVKSLRTKRDVIYGRDVVFDYVTFESTEFNRILDYFRNIVITTTKKQSKEEEVSIVYKNFTFVYGKGGIHGSITNKLITSDEDYLIIDADVSSLYPNIAIANNLYPEHLGVEFCHVYKHDIVDVRMVEKHKKELGDKAVVDGFKEAANATYGNSNLEFSWLYDPLYTMRTTINGQLIISMLCERLLNLKDIILIQANTDGITVRIHKDSIKDYYRICEDWMKLTKWELEFAEYSKMIIYDVNNYIAVYQDVTKEPKRKGKCEFKNIPLHKNKSHSIIPKAVYEYFVNGVDIETTIYNHRNIFDFCAGVKAKKSTDGGSRYELRYVNGSDIVKEKLSKTVRYFISKKGKYLYKIYDSGEEEHVEAPVKLGSRRKDWKVTYFNKAFYPDNFADYDIDYSYYISKAREWIIAIEDKNQLNLFI